MIVNCLEPPKISNLNEEISVTEGEPAKFMVQITAGKPKPTLKWFYNEEEINTEQADLYEFLEIENTHTLVIKASNLNNSGVYFAKVSNEAGCIASNKCKLEVKRKLYINTIYIYKRQ